MKPTLIISLIKFKLITLYSYHMYQPFLPFYIIVKDVEPFVLKNAYEPN